MERRGTTITCFAHSLVRRAVSSMLRQSAPFRVSSPRHGSPASRRAPPMPTAGSILSPIPAADRAPSLLRITAVLSRDSRTASQTTSTPGRRRNDRAAIRKAEGGAGRWGRCDSSFLMLSTIVAVAMWILAVGEALRVSSPREGPLHPGQAAAQAYALTRSSLRKEYTAPLDHSPRACPSELAYWLELRVCVIASIADQVRRTSRISPATVSLD